MSLTKKIEELLKDELKPENIKTVVEMTEFLKFKESQKKWSEINESEPEYITRDELTEIKKVKSKGTFISQEKLLNELGINEDEIHD